MQFKCVKLKDLVGLIWVDLDSLELYEYANKNKFIVIIALKIMI